MYLNKGQEI